MDKVYILEGCKGEYEDYVSFIIGVFTTKEKAELAKEKYIEKLKSISSRYCFAEIKETKDEITSSIISGWYTEDIDQNPEIQEVELDKDLIRFINDEDE